MTDFNPYQASAIEVSTLKRRKAGSYESLRGVAGGLGLILVSIAISFIVGLLARLTKNPSLIEAQFYVTLACGLLTLIGQIRCISAPEESGAKNFAIGSVVCSVVSALLSAVALYYLFRLDLNSLITVSTISGIVSLVGTVCFMLFMKKITQYMDRSDLEKKAQSVLQLAVISLVFLLGGFLIALFPSNANGPNGMAMIGGILALIGLVLMLIMAILYLMLIIAVRSEIKSGL